MPEFKGGEETQEFFSHQNTSIIITRHGDSLVPEFKGGEETQEGFSSFQNTSMQGMVERELSADYCLQKSNTK